MSDSVAYASIGGHGRRGDSASVTSSMSEPARGEGCERRVSRSKLEAASNHSSRFSSGGGAVTDGSHSRRGASEEPHEIQQVK